MLVCPGAWQRSFFRRRQVGWCGRLAAGAGRGAQAGPDACQQLAGAKRLGQIIGRTRVEAANDILLQPLPADDDHRQPGSDPLQQPPAGTTAGFGVEHDQIGALFFK